MEEWETGYRHPLTTLEACEEKTAFGSRKAALRSARVIHKWDGPRMVVYKCNICHRWHLSSYDPDGYL